MKSQSKKRMPSHSSLGDMHAAVGDYTYQSEQQQFGQVDIIRFLKINTEFYEKAVIAWLKFK